MMNSNSDPTLHADAGLSFDAKAATWDEQPGRRELMTALARSIQSFVSLRSDQTLLEYGCGTAALSALLASHVRSIDAADSSAGMIEQVRRKLKETGIGNITPRLLDLTRESSAIGPYDGIVCAMALHHVPDAHALLFKFTGRLAPGGFLALADLMPEDGSFHGNDTIPHRGFDPDSLSRILTEMGMVDIRWKIAHRLIKNGNEYPVFMLFANRVKRIRILFLCTGNSCRSQMAEGWARALKGDRFDAYSAGIEMHGLNPHAVKVMAEAGVDISGHHSKRVDDLKDVDFDYVVTVCGHAHETCPMWLGNKAKVLHVGFDDPPLLAKAARNEQEALDVYRRVRDEIRDFVANIENTLKTRENRNQ